MGLACSITVALLRICSFLVNGGNLSVIFIWLLMQTIKYEYANEAKRGEFERLFWLNARQESSEKLDLCIA